MVCFIHFGQDQHIKYYWDWTNFEEHKKSNPKKNSQYLVSSLGGL